MIPHKIYSPNIEEAALQQFYSAIEQPFVVQAALMSDGHSGYSLPIGAVVATVGKIVPAWVGYDQGCGLCAIPISIPKKVVESNAKAIFDQIYRDVPVGFNHNRTAVESLFLTDLLKTTTDTLQSYVERKEAFRQLGTLGGGNHFIEIGYDETDQVWIIIHSGSRNVGHVMATHYMKIASGDGRAREGHYALNVDSKDGKDYLRDLNFCLQFALSNREIMIKRVIAAICHATNFKCTGDFAKLINRNHNHVEKSTQHSNLPGSEVWIHRKGATHAEKDMLGVIPGNMRDGTFIVKGKGNHDSLCSSSHGAGRVLGRKKAKETISMEDFKKTMAESKVMARVDASTKDESPFAYKNIFEVMEMQKDLVEILHHVKPLINIKGGEKDC